MKVAKEETFGPLAPLFKFGSDDEVIRLANDTEFGLPRTSTAATSAACGRWRKRSNTGWSA